MPGIAAPLRLPECRLASWLGNRDPGSLDRPPGRNLLVIGAGLMLG